MNYLQKGGRWVSDSPGQPATGDLCGLGEEASLQVEPPPGVSASGHGGLSSQTIGGSTTGTEPGDWSWGWVPGSLKSPECPGVSS